MIVACVIIYLLILYLQTMVYLKLSDCFINSSYTKNIKNIKNYIYKKICFENIILYYIVLGLLLLLFIVLYLTIGTIIAYIILSIAIIYATMYVIKILFDHIITEIKFIFEHPDMPELRENINENNIEPFEQNEPFEQI